ncbi:hypothetical protein Tco_1064579, partial [Tanacetum coccineum]
KFPTVGPKVPTAKPTVAADKGNRGKAIKASTCWIWKPKQNQPDQGSNLNGILGIPRDNIDDKGYWDNGCSRHMNGNISYLSEYDPYNRGYVSFRHGGGMITGKGDSQSSKSIFRVFNKRTKKVDKNLHVDFLENQPIEKGTGPNWLFDIDTLTKSMNYVPVVAGTSTHTQLLPN